MKTDLIKTSNEFIIGKNPIKEALASNRYIDSIMVAKGVQKNSLGVIIKTAKELKIPIKEVDSKKLDFLSQNANHQGVIAVVAAHKYSSVDEIFEVAKNKNQHPFIIVADEIADPHNLGAIIRSAECSGAHGVIIPNRRAAGLTFSVAKSAAGALEHIKVARVKNISATLDMLKKRGVWVFGADMDGQTYCQTDLTGPIALVVGSEGFGLSRLIKEKCDTIISLPICGKINSLNASVAAGIFMYEIARQRLKLLAK